MTIMFLDYLQQIPGPARTAQEEAEFAEMVKTCKRLAEAYAVRVVVSPPVTVSPEIGDRLIGLYHPRLSDDQPLVLVVVKRRGDPPQTPTGDNGGNDGFVWDGFHF